MRDCLHPFQTEKQLRILGHRPPERNVARRLIHRAIKLLAQMSLVSTTHSQHARRATMFSSHPGRSTSRITEIVTAGVRPALRFLILLLVPLLAMESRCGAVEPAQLF